MKGPSDRTKVVVRHLPPAISQSVFTEQIDGRFSGLYNWVYFSHGKNRVNCEDEEEQASRMVYRGCSCSPTCKGCTSCICFGCEICRFSDRSCQTCMNFTRNVKP